MTVWHFNIDDFPEEKVEQALNCLPETVRREVTRYRSVDDRKSRLIARILVKKYLSDNKRKERWCIWKKGEHMKPYIENGPYFNISHSGKIVVVCFSEDAEVGVDIEEINTIDTKAMAAHFHKDEVKWLEHNGYHQDQFFRIWTRKEAFLKAKGGGILEGLDQQSILNDLVTDKQEWYLLELDLYDGYKCCICSVDRFADPLVTQIDFNTLNIFINEENLI
ncbi:MAG: 4'-phosphopantetheinyl transferase family protein [Fluviicola sp.]